MNRQRSLAALFALFARRLRFVHRRQAGAGANANADAFANATAAR